MADPTTVNTALIIPNTGADPGTWGAVALNPDFVAIDGFLGGVQTVSASNANILLTSPAGFTPTPSPGPTQSQNGVLRITGVLTGQVQITLPLPGFLIVENLTTGAFVLQLRAVGSGEIIAIEQSSVQHVYNDGTNVRFVNLPQVGSYLDLCDASVPSWISSCTKQPYLNCDGSTFSAVTYPYLNAKLGTNVLPDFRGRGAFYLNQTTNRLTSAGAGIDGNTRFASGGNNGITLAANNIPSLTSSAVNTITVFSTINNIAFGASTSATGGGSFGFNTVTGYGQITSTAAQTITTNYTNGGLVGLGNAAPGVVSGIRLIRAA